MPDPAELLILRFGNASITLLEQDEHGNFYIAVLNERCHLWKEDAPSVNEYIAPP